MRYILSVTKGPVFSIRGVSGGDTDGPSSGAIFATSYMLTLLDEAFPEDVAMTGAIDNRMNIIAVGGLANKLDAAYYMDNGDHQMPIISLVYIPAENKEDFEGWQVSMGLTVTWNDKSFRRPGTTVTHDQSPCHVSRRGGHQVRLASMYLSAMG